MIKNFFKAIGFGMKKITFIILGLYFYFGIIPSLFAIVLVSFGIIQNATPNQLDSIRELCFCSVIINLFFAMFIVHCKEAVQYAKDHNVDIKTAFEATTDYGDDDDL